MNSNRGQYCQPSGSRRSASLTTGAGHSDHSRKPVAVNFFVNPLDTVKDPSKVYFEPYLHPVYRYPLRTTVYTPYLSRSTAAPSKRSTQHIPPQSRPSPAQSSSVLSKRVREDSQSTLYRDSPAPPRRVQILRSSLEPSAKRQRLDVGRSVDRGNSPAPSAGTNQPRVKHRKTPRHPLAVDYSRPIRLVDPRPRHQSLARQSRIPLPPDPEIQDSKRQLEDDLRGPVDPAIAKELGDLMWMQQKRVWGNGGRRSDPFFDYLSLISQLDIWPSSSEGEASPVQSREEVIALCGLAPRTNGFTHLGERLVNPSVIELSNDDDDGAFEEVLDLYRGAVQGSTLSMELELTVGSEDGFAEANRESASALEVSAERGCSVEAQGAMPALEKAVPGQESPLGIEWAYSCCGYATGRAVDPHKARTTRFAPGA